MTLWYCAICVIHSAWLAGGNIQEFYNGPHTQAQSVLQEKIRTLTGIMIFLKEVDEFDKSLPRSFLGWKLHESKILCEFGKPHIHIELTIDINPMWYPFGGALDFTASIVFTKRELHVSTIQIEDSLRNVEPGYNHISRALEKMVNVVESL